MFLAANPLQAAATIGLGLAIGVGGVFAIVPMSVSANDEAGIRGVIMRDRQALDRFNEPSYGGRGGAPRRPSGFESFFNPIVRSFAPQPRLREPALARPALPAPILHGYAPRGGEPLRVLDRTGAPVEHASDGETARKPARARRETPGPNLRYSGVQSRRTICVRMCDGYHFPIGNLDSTTDLAAHETMCQAACPSAPVKLFTVEAGASVEQAMSREQRTYASLPVAFKYRTDRSPSCRCQAPGQQSRISLLRDLTLRPGDTVVTGEQAQVFNGASSWPLKVADFSDFRVSRRLTKSQRARIDSLVGVSYAAALLKPYNVARVERPAPTVVEIVRPEQRAEIVRRVDGPGGQPKRAQGIITLAAPARALRVVESRAAPGFVVR